MALPVDRTIDVEKFPEQVRRFVDPAAPERMKGMVARGLVPMKPLVQVCALYLIAARDGGALAVEAAQTVRAMPVGTVKQIAAERLLPVVLDWLAGLFVESREVLQSIVVNKLTDDETLVRLASECSDPATLELLGSNQARLLASAPLVEALFFNPQVRASSADRLLDFAARNQMDLPNIPDYEAVVAAIAGSLPKSEAEAAAADARFAAAQAALAALSGKSEEEVEVIAAAIAKAAQWSTGEEGEEGAEGKAGKGAAAAVAEEEAGHSSSAAGRIRDLNVAQKVRLAMMGNANDRAVLIRDTNKIVARAVIRSPAISDTEAIGYAKNKSLLEEVINYIANNKKWTRHYQMKVCLVMNPKTPIGEALKLLGHLRVNDLRLVARSKGVPATVAKAAKQLIKTRMK